MTLFERDYEECFNVTMAAFIALLRRNGGHVILTYEELDAGASLVECEEINGGAEFTIKNDG